MMAATDFEATVAPFRGELHAYCYRMLGSVHDADDALQEALLRAWRGLDRFEGRSSLRSWLYRIATNASLDVIERRGKRVLPIELEGEEEPLWLEPYSRSAGDVIRAARERGARVRGRRAASAGYAARCAA